MAASSRTSYLVLIVSIAILVQSFPNSPVNELPVHTIIFSLGTCSLILLLAHRRLSSLFQFPSPTPDYTALPSDEHELKRPGQVASAYSHAKPDDLSLRRWAPLAVLATIALAGRIEIYRRISHATECTMRSPEAFLPLLVATYDCFRNQKASTCNNAEASPRFKFVLQRHLLHRRWRYIPSTFFLSIGCYLTTHLWDSRNSTYICPIVVGETTSIPSAQIVAMFIDSFLVIVCSDLLQVRGSNGHNAVKLPFLIFSASLMTVAIGWTVAGASIWYASPHYRQWLLPRDLVYSTMFISRLLAYASVISVVFLASLYSIAHTGLIFTTVNITSLCFLLPGLGFLWQSYSFFMVAALKARLISFVVLAGAWWSFQILHQHTIKTPGWSKIRSSLIIFAFGLLLYPGWRSLSPNAVHPIDLLIENATLQHQQYKIESSRGHTLQDAVVEYKRRYSSRPPPGFDVWYEYATNHSAVVVDDFDQIHRDLLLFRTVSPAELRLRTWEMIANPWNAISGLTIRNGVASLYDNVIPTHRWMLEGVAILINKFARHLPDMDLAFNINDESRVAVPYADLTRMFTEAQAISLSGHESWSANRSEGWLPITEEEYNESRLRDLAFQKTFHRFGTVGCPDNSPARTRRHFASKAHICYECAAPHSEGQFLSDWALAADICHQPDFAHLHGFYTAPSAFRASYELMPVFSQSKPGGFYDVLYPSAWNYVDKAVYAPTEPSGEYGTDTYQPGMPDVDFKLKKNTLFWRGAASEGASSGDHAWRGMTRQRLAHMANNLTTSQHDFVTLLLPESEADGAKFSYQTLPAAAIQQLGMSIDISIVDRIARCGGVGLHDCTDQAQEFGLVPPTDFQSHWKFRYLFDLDGAGFSGRFLPFLQSKSLPFKTALFREWYDSRLTAWKHFVPQDLRLHGVWSTLAYFAGLSGNVQGRSYHMEPHLKEGEAIATAGREWAAQVLRKEDMELYFFRLLLEWGRLTDDKRDYLGFSI